MTMIGELGLVDVDGDGGEPAAGTAGVEAAVCGLGAVAPKFEPGTEGAAEKFPAPKNVLSPELLPEDAWLVAADVKVAAIETSFGKQASMALRFWLVTSSMYG